MKLKLPLLFHTFVTAKNNHDSETFAACFTADAVVHDERKDYRGRPAIQAWCEETGRKYKVTLVPTGFSQVADTAVLTADVSGNFAGSPFEFRYYFTVRAGEISALRIEA